MRLFESGGLQTKLRISQRGDADEQEADRAAEQIVSRQAHSSTPLLQRKCACGGTCSSCKGEEEREQIIHRSAVGPLRAFPFSIQRAAADQSTAQPAAEEGQRHDQAKHPGERPHALVVEDNAPSLASGQMRKTEFLNLLQSSTCATADAVLEAVGHSTQGCPYIKKWLAHYRGTDAQHLTRAIHKYAPETIRARSAHEAIALVNHRVQRAALSWAKTGKVSDLPEGIQEEMGGGGLLGAVSGFVHSGFGKGLLGFLGGGKKESGTGGKAEKGVQRKSRDGAAAGVHDAAAVKEQLGSGHSLDGQVQSQMSAAFGYDFAGVRVHTDAKAGELSGQLNARAFTIGSDLAFAGGEYKPGTLIGDALIAHELAHVVQQGGGTQAGTAQNKSASLNDESSLEQDADRSAVGAMVSAWTGAKKGLTEIGANALPRLKSGLKLQKCSKPESKDKPAAPAALGDFNDKDELHDPSKLTDAQITPTSEFKSLMDPSSVWQSKDHVTQDEALLCCRLMLRQLRDGKKIAGDADVRVFLDMARSQLGVLKKTEGEVGKLQWVPFNTRAAATDPSTLQSDFARWILASGPEPDAGTGKVNCWEMVMFSAYKGGFTTKARIKGIYDEAVRQVKAGTRSLVGDTVEVELRQGKEYVLDPANSKSPEPLPGDIVIFNKAAGHVAISRGTKDRSGRHVIVSHWPPPDGDYKTKLTTIEELLPHIDLPKIVKFWSPKW